MIEKKAVTTNNTEPMQPTRPKVRKPAAGPLLTTGNTDRATLELGKPVDLKKGMKKGGADKPKGK